MEDYRVIGACSLCGGEVVVPTIWMGVTPPVPRCKKCDAVKAPQSLPVIPMKKQSKQTT